VGSIPTRSRHPGRARTGSPAPGVGRPSGRKVSAVLGLAVALLVSAAPGTAFAQQPDSASGASREPAPDTTPRAPADTARTDSAGRRPSIAPLGALARSLVVPGWGQASVGRPVRGAFYFAAQAGSLFMVVKSQQKLEVARRAVAAGRADSSLVESRVSQREDWIVLSVFWAVLSGVDAWVSANLSDFQHPLTPPPDGSPGAAIQIRVPVGGP